VGWHSNFHLRVVSAAEAEARGHYYEYSDRLVQAVPREAQVVLYEAVLEFAAVGAVHWYTAAWP
jgi:hypothetical protein